MTAAEAQQWLDEQNKDGMSEFVYWHPFVDGVGKGMLVGRWGDQVAKGPSKDDMLVELVSKQIAAKAESDAFKREHDLWLEYSALFKAAGLAAVGTFDEWKQRKEQKNHEEEVEAKD